MRSVCKTALIAVLCLLLCPASALADGGVLADLAPTMLDMMGLPQPAEMTGHSLLVK